MTDEFAKELKKKKKATVNDMLSVSEQKESYGRERPILKFSDHEDFAQKVKRDINPKAKVNEIKKLDRDVGYTLRAASSVLRHQEMQNNHRK